MFEKGILFLVLVIVSTIIGLVALVGVIAKWKRKKVRNICIAIFICSLVSGCLSLGYLLYRTVTLGGQMLKEEVQTSGLYQELLATPAFIDSLKLYEPEGVEVPESFYLYYGFRDYYRIPLVYPYSLTCIDELNNASIEDESDVSNVFLDSNNSKQILYGIEYFTFDGNMLLAKTKEGAGKEIFLLLNFRLGNIEYFDTELELKDKAAMQGFDTIKTMKTPYDYYNNPSDFF